MAVFEGSFRSQALGMDTGLSLCLPQDTASYNPETMGTLILLHGLHGNHTGWFRKTSVERYASAHNLAVICPDGNNSMYADTTYGADYFKYITAELPEFAAKMFHLPIDPDHLYIAGLSKGGYGALKAALACPDRFSKCAAFSSGTMLGHPDRMAKYANGNTALVAMGTGAYGSDIKYENPDNIYYLADTCDKKALPELLITCGMQDYLYEENLDFRAHLKSLDIPFTWKEWDGVHDWKFWDESIKLAVETFF